MQNALHTVLKEHFGFDQFRAGQEQTIRQILEGHSSLAIFPTGAGKSLCFQMPAVMLPGLTLVVSPLLALMKNQLDFMQSKRIPSASLDSTLSADEQKSVMAAVRSGEIKVLMVSVERFKNERFRQFVSAISISLLVIDEAHCISEWGHNFRPDYLKLPVYQRQLNVSRVLLLTATATPAVCEDMLQKFSILPSHLVKTGFYRHNLDLVVEAVPESARLSRLLELVQQEDGQGIVYVTLQNTADEVAGKLVKAGINAESYHAGLGNECREKIQQRFANSHIQVVVATIAFGMGIDIANIRFVHHYDLPKSIENYSQETGRSGRDGLPSRCVVLGNLDGLNTLENFVYGDTPELSGIQNVIETIRSQEKGGNFETSLYSLSMQSNIRELTLKTLMVQLELRGILIPSHSYYADYRYALSTPKEAILSRFNDSRQQFLNCIFENTRFAKKWGEPDFQTISRLSGSDRGRIVRALEYLEELGLITIEAKNATEVWHVNGQALQQAALAQSLEDYFRKAEDREIARIGHLIDFFQGATCLSTKLSRYFGDHQAPDRCGHCSVCRGKAAVLSRSTSPQWPSEAELRNCLTKLSLFLHKKSGEEASITQRIKFLAGIGMPLFSRTKANRLEGFGCCASQRYAEIAKRVRA